MITERVRKQPENMSLVLHADYGLVINTQHSTRLSFLSQRHQGEFACLYI
ncbi:hypothetical protein AQUSIP_26150 [Aquicella siphonis]|uniref:Uncharacterized protein n=1 Tax=Aquicella siphonis TaxID=254247 RepID=A0A5E4PL61_9COXI|nr:hypothetical protein AQUSIP_26150 [Aquicella siphonis]